MRSKLNQILCLIFEFLLLGLLLKDIFMAKFEFTDQNFQEDVLNFKGIVLVDFWAPWCGPCTQLGPIVDELSENEQRENVKIGKINIDDNSETAAKYGVMSIPTLLLFKDGEVAEQMVGVQTKEVLEEKINSLM